MFDKLENAKRLYALKLKQKLPKTKRYIFEDVINSKAKLTAIYGSRGVGKTTMLMQIIKESKLSNSKKLYISCDHTYLQDVSLFDFVDEFVKRGGEMICIDEIHEADNFEKELKEIYDFLNVKIYFTGSSAIAIKNPDLSRRYSMYHLSTLSFREYLNIAYKLDLQSFSLEQILSEHEEISYEISDKLKQKKVLKEFDTYLKTGVYPFYFEDKIKYIDKINDMIDKILYIDIGKIYLVKPDKIDSLKKLIATICVSKPFEFTLEELAKKIGITKSTLYKYLYYLDKAEIINIVTNEAKRFANIRKSDKLYLSNTNLLEAICINKEKGTVRETFFVNILKPKHKIHYSNRGDFLINEKYVAEVGGKNKSFNQIKDIPHSFIAADDIEVGFADKIPLWLFGFLY